MAAIIFHGSDIAVPEPRIIAANRLLDFGEGFLRCLPILFHTARALRYCVYVGHESVEDGSNG